MKRLYQGVSEEAYSRQDEFDITEEVVETSFKDILRHAIGSQFESTTQLSS